MSLINNSININDELFEGSDSKGKNNNNISFINNSKASTTKENSGEKKENLDISIYSITSNFEDNFFTQINNYVNYPKIEELNIPIDESDKKKEKYLPMRINSFLAKLDIITEKLDNILKSSIFDMIIHSTNIKNNAKFKLFTISNLRLEILINLSKNANIINIKRKLIEVLIYHLYLENKDYFKLSDDYIPSDKNIKDSEEYIQNEINNLIEKSKIKAIDYKQHNNLIDYNKKYELGISKRFLDFYKKELNPDVHIGKSNADFYLLPRCMFNPETLLGEYLFDLEAIIINSNKTLEVNEAIKILFSHLIQNLNTCKIKLLKKLKKNKENSRRL